MSGWVGGVGSLSYLLPLPITAATVEGGKVVRGRRRREEEPCVLFLAHKALRLSCWPRPTRSPTVLLRFIFGSFRCCPVEVGGGSEWVGWGGGEDRGCCCLWWWWCVCAWEGRGFVELLPFWCLLLSSLTHSPSLLSTTRARSTSQAKRGEGGSGGAAGFVHATTTTTTSARCPTPVCGWVGGWVDKSWRGRRCGCRWKPGGHS